MQSLPRKVRCKPACLGGPTQTTRPHLGKTRKNRRKKRGASTRSAPTDTRSLGAVRAEVGRLIAREKTKSAVELAKLTHKQVDSEASELLLGEAYVARIHGMLAKGMGDEARALLVLVQGRHPAAAHLLEGLALDLAAQTGSFDELLRPLAGPGLPAAERHRIEEALRHRATDLRALAECRVLPVEHALRQAAQAAWDAFQAVTSGPVEAETLDLPGISRRSPLAPWKALIRAIGAFYRAEDELCKRYLRAVEPGTPAARLVPAIEAMLDRAPPPADNPKLRGLMNQVAGGHRGLRRQLGQIDAILDETEHCADGPKLVKALRGASSACAALDASLAKRLHRYMWIRSFHEGFDVSILDQLFVAPVPRDAAFWALLAQFHMIETDLYADNPIAACAAWEESRSQSVHEGLFAAGSPESAVFYRLMLNLLVPIPDIELRDLREEFFEEYPSHETIYRGQPKHLQRGASAFRVDRPATVFFLHPELLYARVADADPSPRLYREWFEWNSKHGSAKLAEGIMTRWKEAFPKDAEPLLLLVEAAERRSAYKKALGYLAQAEAIDALNPKVRRAHFRLHLRAFERHFKQNKAHLAAKDLDAIESIPPLDGHDRRAIEAALRAALGILAGDSEASARYQFAGAEILGDTLAAQILCWGVAGTLGVPFKRLPPLTGPSARLGKGVRAAAAARANALAKDAGITLPWLNGWDTKLRVDFRDHARDVDPAHLEAYAEALIENEEHDMAYYVTRAGLLQEGPHLARFLLLRAKALPRSYPWRQMQCASAAVQLARNQRHFDVLDEAVDLLNTASELNWMGDPHSKFEIDAQHVQQVLSHERKQKKAPESGGYAPVNEKRYYPKCTCEACRSGRKYRPPRPSGPFAFDPFGDEDEDSIFDDLPDASSFLGDWDPFGGEMPEELESKLEATVEELVGKGRPHAEIEETLVRILLEYAQKQTGQKRPAADDAPGEQGNLFDDSPF